MPLLHTTPLVQLLLRIDTSWPLRTLFSAPQALYPLFILCTTSLSHPPSAATCDPRYLKQSTSSNGSPLVSHAFGSHYHTWNIKINVGNIRHAKYINSSYVLYNNTIIHFIETRLPNAIGIIIKIQMAWLTGWLIIW